MKKPHLSGSAVLSLLLLLASAPVVLGNAPLDLAGAQVVSQAISPYNGELTVLDYRGLRYLIARTQQGIMLQSSMNLGDRKKLMEESLQTMALLTALHPQPQHVFNLGMGGASLPKFHFERYPESEIDSAEIDRTVIGIARQYFYATDVRQKFLEGEGFDLLRKQEASRKYDLIWVDAMTPKEGPKSFVKSERLTALREHLKPDGVIVANLGEARSAETFRQEAKAYRKGYRFGIRIATPRSMMARTEEVLKAFAARKGDTRPRTLMPSYYVAVGNRATLTCARFNSLYREWKAKGLVADKPGEERSCEDLTEDL